MKLYLIRHAIAAEAADGPDEARALTREGRARFEECVRGLAQLEVRLDRIVHSPLLRAVQTADLLRPLLQGTSAVSGHLAAQPSEALLAELAGERVAAVGHEPWLGELAAWLVTSQRAWGPRFSFEKGSVALLEGELEPGAMHFSALLPPSALRKLGR